MGIGDEGVGEREIGDVEVGLAGIRVAMTTTWLGSSDGHGSIEPV